MKIDGHTLKRTVPFQCAIDATPDGGYALRILRRYRQDCDACWSDNTSGELPTKALLRAMNDLQKKRAEELDKAITLLAKGLIFVDPEVYDGSYSELVKLEKKTL